MTASALPYVRRGTGRPSATRIGWIALFAGAILLYVVFAGSAPQETHQDSALFLWINDVRSFVRDTPLFAAIFDLPRQLIDTLVMSLTEALHAIGWPALVAVMATIGLAAGGWLYAALGAVGMLSIGALGFWDAGVDTLAAITVAVSFSLAIGVPIGILVARNRRLRNVVTPFLDVMQIMPTFAYLAPLVLLFGIGGAAATIVVLIYAMPAAIRITELGIRGVAPAAVEAGESLGATRWQLLTKVRLPLAAPALALAVNQVIMLALSMIVITALIDAPGLGQDIYRALVRTNVGDMFDAGIAIVILAIVLDRLTEQVARRVDPRQREAQAGRAVSRRVLMGAIAITVALIVVGLVAPFAQEFPPAIAISFADPINGLVDWLRSDASGITGAIKDAISYTILNPLQTVLTESPWWLLIVFVAGLAYLISGAKHAFIAAVCLLAIVLLGLWQHAMETLLQVLAATAITLLIGLTLGIMSARNDRFAQVLRPFLDVAQTLPSFVYLLPALVLFDAGRFTAILAAIAFAVPPVIRVVDVGIRQVPATVVEAATAAGATGWQILTKVRLPVARPALMLAVNQSVIIVLSMVVVGGLVGGQALGYDVVAGFSQSRLFGMGVAAGAVLVLLGIVLDRVTQGAGARRRTTAL
jgi:glycine betaine/proline transport system permease protein